MGLVLAGLVAAPLLIHGVIAVAPGATLLAFALPFVVSLIAGALRLLPFAAGLAAGGVVWIGVLYLVLSGLQT